MSDRILPKGKYDYTRLLIGGRWTEPAGERFFEIRSPHDHQLTGRTPEATQPDVDRAVTAARKAFDEGPWPRMTPAERAEVITRFAELHRADGDELAALTTAENGSAIWFTTMLQKIVYKLTDDFLRLAADHPWEEELVDPESGLRTIVRREPAGVVAAVIPWNAPQQSALVKLVPALLAGNSVILKPSPETALDGVRLGELFVEAGLPDGVLSVLPAEREVSQYLVGHAGVDKIAFTGSTVAGRAIASLATGQLKRVSLELGGKSAAIVLADADLDQVVEGIRYGSFGNDGEACVALTRVLAPRSRYEEVVTAIGALAESLKVGDPADPDTFIGPMVREGQRDRVEGYIRSGIEEGARVVTGGLGAPEGLETGYYVRPTVFADVDNSMRIAQEEIFGPVIVVIPYEDEAEAIRIANDSPYGLNGAVFTADREHGVDIARAIRTGGFSVNGAPRHWEAPFGGYKNSGFGREYGRHGLDEYVELKAIGTGLTV
ncbi:MAG TPA: aldehyde dehydrogenase [Pseudonocardiaceae bacterium]|jgi:acyl-CoA reductase-like NAD-dependent aldehyde dehydrogenase|nr:aldehyde dehydrogenase [Pseudonocardiaceae bacterium]